MKERLKRAITDSLEKQVDFSVPFADWGIDSLDYLLMLQAVEEEFPVEIPEDAAAFETFDELGAWLESRC